MLSVRKLHVAYGRTEVLHGIDLEVGPGETVSMVGPNGAGKTTLVRTLSGLIRPTAGTMTFDGSGLASLSPARIVALGLVQVPEGAGVFRELSVRDNLLLVCREPRELDSVLDLFAALRARLDLSAGALSGGERQMLGLARALLLRPRLLILDEPSLGLAPRIVAEVFDFLRDIRSRGEMSLLLVEQNIEQSLGISDRGYVLVSGECVHSGAAAEMLADQTLRQKYLSLA